MRPAILLFGLFTSFISLSQNRTFINLDIGVHQFKDKVYDPIGYFHPSSFLTFGPGISVEQELGKFSVELGAFSKVTKSHINLRIDTLNINSSSYGGGTSSAVHFPLRVNYDLFKVETLRISTIGGLHYSLAHDGTGTWLSGGEESPTDSTYSFQSISTTSGNYASWELGLKLQYDLPKNWKLGMYASFVSAFGEIGRREIMHQIGTLPEGHASIVDYGRFWNLGFRLSIPFSNIWEPKEEYIIIFD